MSGSPVAHDAGIRGAAHEREGAHAPLQNDALQLCTIWQDQKPLIQCPSSWDSTQVETLIGQADAQSLPELQSKLQLVSAGFHV